MVVPARAAGARAALPGFAGERNRARARHLQPTVRTHLTSLFAKIGVSSGKELLRWGIRHPDAIATGIVRPGRESEPLKPMPKVA